jgi:pyrroloquinoline quinone (PQQ) biosynthesis protein C
MSKLKGEALQPISRFNAQYETRLGEAILDGSVSKKNIRLLAKQVYLQEKWPSHIAHVYLSLDENALADRRVVGYILSIIRAENLGVGSNGVSHTELARRFACSIGLSERSLSAARPTPTNQMLMDWCDMSALDRPWLAALAVHVACESQVKTMRNIARGLQTHYGVSPRDIEFWTVHGGPVERRHMEEGLSIIEDYIRPDNKASVEYAYKVSCQLVCNFYDSILEEE